MLTWLKRIAFAIYAADTAIITTLIDNHVITTQQGVDIGAVIAALAAGFHGGLAVSNMNGSTANEKEGTPSAITGS